MSRSFFSLALASLLLIFSAVCFAQPAQTEIKVRMKKFEFIPKTITVGKGEKVKLAITAEDVAHGFAISDFDIDVRVQAGQTKTIELTADREGKFEITCSVFCGDGHPEMTGQMVVTSPQSSSVKVNFDDDAPGVVVVEANGQRIRIDTTKKTVVSLSEAEAVVAQGKAERKKGEERTETARATEGYDYRVVNLPTPKRVPRHSLNVYFSHRFQQPVFQEEVPFRDELENLFGLDSFSVSSLGFTYGITDRLYVNAHRSPVCQPGLCKAIEIGVGYHLLDEAGRSPIALSAYAGVEGNDNFSEEFTWSVQAMMARSVTRYVNLFFSPAVHLNANGSGRFNPRLGEIFPLDPQAQQFSLGRHTVSFGFGVNARIRPTASLLFEYVPRAGFRMGRVDAEFDPTFSRILRFTNDSEAAIGFGIEKRIGRHSFALTFSNTQTTTTARYNSSNLFLPPGRFTIGFNLFRRLL
jgi:cytochrome c oxidase subunit 2